MTDLINILLGLFAGCIGTIIGAGGGFIIIPYLLLARHFSPQAAIGTTLAVVFLNTFFSSFAYARQKRIDYPSAWRFAVATIPGAFSGYYIARFFTGPIYRDAFGTLLVCIAFYCFFRSFEKTESAAGTDANLQSPDHQAAHKLTTIVDAAGTTYAFSYNLKMGVLISLAVGFLASIMGIGGGIIHVPLLIYALGFPAHIATASSYFILAISTSFAVLPHLAAGNVNYQFMAMLAIGAIAGGQLGARLSKKIKGPNIVRALALALFFLGLRLITS